LIVILFRSGCTLPDSKLEIYRSCIGTLTEKWDAAGKRLELPENYNRVRDKKNAFARIAYWMYQQQSLGASEQRRLKYQEVRDELTRYLCEREFRGTESEAQQAAEDFLEYSAKRSIFIEDRFSHKTFHEYFAALYIYRNYCLGKTVEDLYQEIKPFLSSDSWAVVLELLMLMLDEQSGSLLDTLLSKIIGEVEVEPSHSYDLLLAPLRTLAQLHNIGREKVRQLISNAMEICIHIPSTAPWQREPNRKEAPHERVFAALEKLPRVFYPIIVANLRQAAEGKTDPIELLPIVAFHYEFPTHLDVKLDEIIANWEQLRETVAQLHLCGFYSYVPPGGTKASERIQKFVNCFGRDMLFEETDVIFRPGVYFVPVAEFTLRSISSEREVAPYDLTVSDLLSVDESDYLLSGLVARSAGGIELSKSPSVIIEHLSTDYADVRKYLVDWLVLVRILRSQALHPAILNRCEARLRSIMRKGKPVQKFYATLLCKKEITHFPMDLLQLGPKTQSAIAEYSRHLGSQEK